MRYPARVVKLFDELFDITPVWDDEAKVFVSDSSIDGFHIEAETIEDFDAIIGDAVYVLFNLVIDGRNIE